MPRRKDRVRVVFDTNVLIRHYRSVRKTSANSKVFRLWRVKRELQLIVSPSVVEEYVEVLARVGVSQANVAKFAAALDELPTTTHVNLGSRADVSRDADDNVMIDTALAGRAAFIVTNDTDLLDIPAADLQRYRFRIVTPQELLTALSL